MIQRTALIFVVLSLCLSLAGCVLATKEQVTTFSVPHVAGSPLMVTARNGHIIVRAGQNSQVQIVATLRMTSDERLATTTIAANRDSAGTLVVTANPPAGSWYGNEGCSFEVSLPDVQGVILKSSNGRIELSGAAGAASLKTSNGSISISQHDGPIDADTSNGRIEITGAMGPVKADTSNGSVKIRLAPSAPGPVDIDTSNGSVTLELGSSFAGTINARTSNGSVSGPERRDGSPSFAFERLKKSHARVRVGSGGPDSSISSSNGSISIRFAE